ncbi:hypothetical protein AgCh_029105 [Apium graveolens]
MACTIEQFGDWLCNKRAIGIATLKSKLEDMIRGGKTCVIEDIPGDPKVRLYPEARKREGKESQDRLTAIGSANVLGTIVEIDDVPHAEERVRPDDDYRSLRVSNPVEYFAGVRREWAFRREESESLTHGLIAMV